MKASIRKFKTFIRLILVLIVLALVLGGIFGWKYLQMQEMEKQLSQPEPPAVIETTQVQAKNWRTSITAVGSVRAVNGVEVANEVAGVVSKLDFESNDRVKQGDVLIQIEDSVDQAALKALQAQADQARDTFDRYSKLLPRNAISRSEYDEAQANYQAAKANVAEQEALIAKKTVRAPFDGVVGLRQVDLGQYIPVGTSIVDLNMLDPIYVDYSVPERLYTEMTAGRQVEVRVAAYPDKVFEGEIVAISNAVDQSSRTFDVRARFANPEQLLRPGMFADVSSLAPEPQAVLILPRTALSFNTYGNFVFRVEVDESGELIAKRVQVTTGRTRGDEVVISDGLDEGARVVATGLLRLRDGQRVALPDSRQASSDEDAEDAENAQGAQG